MESLHKGHQVMSKMHFRAKQNLYWTVINEEIRNDVENCIPCQVVARAQQKEPTVPIEIPFRPWQKIGMDLFFCKGKWYLIVCNYYSKLPVFRLLPSMCSKNVISALESNFRVWTESANIGRGDMVSYFNVMCVLCYLLWYVCIYCTLMFLYILYVSVYYISIMLYVIYTIYFPFYLYIPLYICMPPGHPPYIYSLAIHPPSVYAPICVHSPKSIHPHTYVCPQVHMSLHFPYVHMPPSICTVTGPYIPLCLYTPIYLYKLYNSRPVI